MIGEIWKVIKRRKEKKHLEYKNESMIQTDMRELVGTQPNQRFQILTEPKIVNTVV